MKTQLLEMAENAYALAVTHNEHHAKEALWNILLVLKQADYPVPDEKFPLAASTSPASIQQKRNYAPITNKRDMLIIAYVLSEFGHEFIFPGEKHTQEAAIIKAAKIMNVNYNTLRNQRDYFDSFTNSHREGWKKDLTKEQRDVFDYMIELNRDEITNLVKNILHKT